MKKAIKRILLLLSMGLLVTMSYAGVAPSTVTMNFDLSNFKNLKLAQLVLNYTGKYDDAPLIFQDYRDLMALPQIQFGDAFGATLQDAQFSGETSDGYVLTNRFDSDYQPPHNPLCDIRSDYKAGKYNVVFFTEPLYMVGSQEMVGYWIECKIQQIS